MIFYFRYFKSFALCIALGLLFMHSSFAAKEAQVLPEIGRNYLFLNSKSLVFEYDKDKSSGLEAMKNWWSKATSSTYKDWAVEYYNKSDRGLDLAKRRANAICRAKGYSKGSSRYTLEFILEPINALESHSNGRSRTFKEDIHPLFTGKRSQRKNKDGEYPFVPEQVNLDTQSSSEGKAESNKTAKVFPNVIIGNLYCLKTSFAEYFSDCFGFDPTKKAPEKSNENRNEEEKGFFDEGLTVGDVVKRIH